MFDTTIHTGTEATDAKVRAALVNNPAQRAPSSFARSDGRPLMYDFEFRLWQQSMADAKIQPSGARFDINAKASEYYVVDSRGAIVRPKGAADKAADAQARQEDLKKQAAKDAKAAKLGRHNPSPRKCPNMPPKVQAPTGEGLE